MSEYQEQPDIDVGEDQGQTPVGEGNWFEQSWDTDTLGELGEVGQHSIFQKYNTPIDFIQGAINAQSQIGQKATEFWKSEDPNDIALRNEIMGIPESAENYNIELPEGFDVTDEEVTEFYDTMHSLGINNEQAQAIADYTINNMVALSEGLEQNDEEVLESAEAQLREIYKGDEYEYQLSKVADALDYLGLDEWKDIPEIANNPDFIVGMVEKIIPLFSEDELIQGSMQDSYSSINDQLAQVEGEIDNYQGAVGDRGYQQLLNTRFDLLKKLTPNS